MSQPQELSGGGELGDIPFLRPPRAEPLFARRAERFAALAPGHTLSEYLELLARIAAAQRIACATVAPSVNGLDLPRERPLLAATHRRGGEWRDALTVVLGELRTAALPDEGREALERLASAPARDLEALGDRVLANAVEGTDLAAGPFVAAGLQVYFTSLSAQLPPEAVAPARDGCPVCGSLPVVGVVLGDDKLRYLVCSLCAAQWHHTRVQCTACHEGKGIAYYNVEGDSGAAKAEACPSCKAYTKLFYVEKDMRIEPFADDVATLALDLLMAENGWVRHGVNLFLLPAEERGPAAS